MKLLDIFKRKQKQKAPNIEVQPVIIMEETVSVSHKIQKQRVNPGLKYEGIDFFWAKKILYPATMEPEIVEKMRAQARDLCWQQIHYLELDFVHSHEVYTWETVWERIQEARKREAEKEALREIELRQDEEAKAKLGIEDIPEISEEELDKIGLSDDVLDELEKQEILAEAFPKLEDSLPPNASPGKRTGEPRGIDTESGAGTGNLVMDNAFAHGRGESGKGKEPVDNESKADEIIKKAFGDIL